MSLLIKNGRIITAADDYVADIFIENEKISTIGKNIDVKADQVIDASGKLVIPGGIDPHVHLDMPFMGTYSSDNYETGTRAALFGGTTTVIDFVIQTQGKTLHDALAAWRGRSDGNCGVHRRACRSARSRECGRAGTPTCRSAPWNAPPAGRYRCAAYSRTRPGTPWTPA